MVTNLHIDYSMEDQIVWPFLNRVKTLFQIKKIPTFSSSLILSTRGHAGWKYALYSTQINEEQHKIHLFLLSQGWLVKHFVPHVLL